MLIERIGHARRRARQFANFAAQVARLNPRDPLFDLPDVRRILIEPLPIRRSERAPQRSYYYAMGMTEEEIARPFVAVASAGNDSAPCNTTLDFQADICREGVIEGGGTPRRFNTITVTDGIAMGHQGMRSSLVSREVIADSIELSVRGHCYDAIVGFAGSRACAAV